MLLLGRLASFASGDMARKRKVFSLRGTFGGSGAPPGTFPGMMPSSGRVPMPMGFSPPREHPSPSSDTLEDADLEELTNAALQEWASIRHAFEVIQEQFGPEFAQLDADLAPPISTPFGPAAQYRTYGVAGIWLNYYMGLIILYRSHPEMPPVAMMAAGMSAHQTTGYAIEIGRIAAGLDEGTEQKSAVSTLIGAAFIESSFPTFVAAVQVGLPSSSFPSQCNYVHSANGGKNAEIDNCGIPFSFSRKPKDTGSSAACTTLLD